MDLTIFRIEEITRTINQRQNMYNLNSFKDELPSYSESPAGSYTGPPRSKCCRSIKMDYN